MSKKVVHKFQEKVESSYEELIRARFVGIVELTKEFERALGRERTLEIIGKSREHRVVDLTKKELIKKPIEAFEGFKAIEKEENASPFWSHVLTFTYTEDTPKKLALCVTECLYAKACKDLNATELGYVMFCHPDYAYAQACHPKIKLKRTKTLMQGDNHCNHTYYWDE